ncbi:right-handed parallel beta-helix repeat-containing protein [Streptomyces sp. NPDC002490]|uniref:right-handed parallel beta-helix repeat-containing protein n=1 Tax=Streptomyces sp. NPDC002490 TaxID=3154416 RepID=UPI0033229180
MSMAAPTTRVRFTLALSLVWLLVATFAGGQAFASDHTSPRAAGSPTGTTYYIDAVTGQDSNSGTTTAAPWRSLDRVNSAALYPGDTVAFRRGRTWAGSLLLSASGTPSAPIGITAYGSTPASPPVIGGAVPECVRVTGSYWRIGSIRASDCLWAGFEIRGSHNLLSSVWADNNVVGVSVAADAHHNTLQNSTLTDNNKMSVNTPGGSDDSGAFGVLLNGDDNIVTRNLITNSRAVSYDFGHDGAAVEVFNGDRNRVEYNTARDNTTFTELGREPGRTADGNIFAFNAVTSVHPASAFLVTRGAETGTGPVYGTRAINNSVNLTGPRSEGWVCYAGCAPNVLTLRNNIIKAVGKTGYEDGAGADEDAGVHFGAQTQFHPGPRSVLGDPAFVSATDLRLTGASPAIARGVPVPYGTDLTGDPVSTTRPDAGAYQFAP